MAVRKGARRITFTIDEAQAKLVEYWAARDMVSVNEFVADAVDHYIRHKNHDYDLPDIEVARLNQLVDLITVLSSDIKSLEDVTVSGFDALVSLTRGDNYLIDRGEDGEI